MTITPRALEPGVRPHATSGSLAGAVVDLEASGNEVPGQRPGEVREGVSPRGREGHSEAVGQSDGVVIRLKALERPQLVLLDLSPEPAVVFSCVVGHWSRLVPSWRR